MTFIAVGLGVVAFVFAFAWAGSRDELNDVRGELSNLREYFDAATEQRDYWKARAEKAEETVASWIPMRLPAGMREDADD